MTRWAAFVAPASSVTPAGGVVAGTLVSMAIPCWKKLIRSLTLLVLVTVKVEDGSVRPPWVPARVSVSPVVNVGVVGVAGEETVVSRLAAVGAGPAVVVRSWLSRMLDPVAAAAEP